MFYLLFGVGFFFSSSSSFICNTKSKAHLEFDLYSKRLFRVCFISIFGACAPSKQLAVKIKTNKYQSDL